MGKERGRREEGKETEGPYLLPNPQRGAPRKAQTPLTGRSSSSDFVGIQGTEGQAPPLLISQGLDLILGVTGIVKTPARRNITIISARSFFFFSFLFNHFKVHHSVALSALLMSGKCHHYFQKLFHHPNHKLQQGQGHHAPRWATLT